MPSKDGSQLSIFGQTETFSNPKNAQEPTGLGGSLSLFPVFIFWNGIPVWPCYRDWKVGKVRNSLKCFQVFYLLDRQQTNNFGGARLLAAIFQEFPKNYGWPKGRRITGIEQERRQSEKKKKI